MVEQNRVTFGKIIRQFRKKSGLKLDEVCRKIGKISPAYLSQLERDRMTPSEDVARRIAKVYDTNEEELIFLARRVAQTLQEISRKYPNMAARKYLKK